MTQKPEYQAKDFTEFLEFVFDAVRSNGRGALQACSRPQSLLLGFETSQSVYLVALSQLVGAAKDACGAKAWPQQVGAWSFRPSIETILDFYGHKVQATMIAAESPPVDTA